MTLSKEHQAYLEQQPKVNRRSLASILLTPLLCLFYPKQLFSYPSNAYLYDLPELESLRVEAETLKRRCLHLEKLNKLIAAERDAALGKVPPGYIRIQSTISHSLDDTAQHIFSVFKEISKN